jgi:hypothetical protein
MSEGLARRNARAYVDAALRRGVVPACIINMGFQSQEYEYVQRREPFVVRALHVRARANELTHDVLMPSTHFRHCIRFKSGNHGRPHGPAMCSAVQPLPSPASAFAPWSSRKRVTSSAPTDAAQCSGARVSCDADRTSVTFWYRQCGRRTSSIAFTQAGFSATSARTSESCSAARAHARKHPCVPRYAKNRTVLGSGVDGT